MAFSPDGTTLASVSADRTVRLWPVTVEAWIERACALAGRNLTQDEWDQFVGADRGYVRTCAGLPAGAGAPVDAPAAAYRSTEEGPASASNAERRVAAAQAGRSLSPTLVLASGVRPRNHRPPRVRIPGLMLIPAARR